jgi:ABC-2 type transport system permease protein
MTFWTIALNDLKITYKDKMFVVWLLVFPLIFIFIFGMAFQGYNPGDQQVTLNILNKDKGFLSQAMIKELSTDRYMVTVLDKDEEKNFRTLIIPDGFTENVLAGKKVELILEQEQGKSLEAMQSAYSHVLKAIIKIISKIVLTMPENMDEFQENFEQLNLERKISLRTEMGGKLKEVPAGFNRSVPGMTIMFLLFTVLMYGGINLLQERRLGHLERIYFSPATLGSIIGGKWLSRIIIGIFQVALLFLIGRFLFKVDLGPSFPLVLLLSLFFCATIASMSILFGCIIKKVEILIVLNILAANIMAALGGCWWPLELVPKGLRTAGFVFPTGWIMDAYTKLIFFGDGLEAVWLNLVVLAGFTITFLYLAVKFFKIKKN